MPDHIVTIQTQPVSATYSLQSNYSDSFTLSVATINNQLYVSDGFASQAYSESTDNTLTDAEIQSIYDGYSTFGIPPTQTLTPHSYLTEFGKYVSIDLPTPRPEWGVLVGIGFIISGDLGLSYTASGLRRMFPNQAFGYPNPQIAPTWYEGSGIICEFTPAGVSNSDLLWWNMQEGWIGGAHEVMPDGYDAWVYRSGYLAGVSDHHVVPMNWHWRAPGEFADCSDVNDGIHRASYPYAWVVAHWGTTQTLRCKFSASQILNPSLVAVPNPAIGFGSDPSQAGVYTRAGVCKETLIASNFTLQMCLHFHSSGSTGKPHTIVADTFNNIVVTAWVTDQNNLYIGKNRRPLAASDYDVYLYGPVDAGSQLGLAFLPNGQLILTYTKGGNQVYSVSKQFGNAGSWSAPANLTPAVADMLNVGRAQGQTFCVRI